MNYVAVEILIPLANVIDHVLEKRVREITNAVRVNTAVTENVP